MQLTTSHKLDAGKSSVHSVTVFKSDCAEVVRKFVVNLKTGENVIEISHLPHAMSTDSLRVAGVGQAILSDVVCITPKRIFGTHSGKSNALIALEEEKALLLSQKGVVDWQANLLVNYSKGISSEHVAPDAMLGFLQNFVEAGNENAKASMALQTQLRDVEQKIQKEMEHPSEEHDTSHLRNIKVKLNINSDEDHVAEISLTYLVKRASWVPVFDLRAVTGSDGKPTNKIALHYRASVKQSTGEDWTDATLTLSTATPDMTGTTIPKLSSLKITPKPWGGLFGKPQQNINPPLFGQKAPQQTNAFGGFGQSNVAPAQGLFGQYAQQQATGFGAFGSTNTAPPPAFGFGTSNVAPTAPTNLFGTAAPTDSTLPPPSDPVTGAHVPEEDNFSEIDELPQMEVPSAVTKENSMVATFQVKGSANIQSDDAYHKVALAILNLTAKIESVAIPRSITGPYLQCTIHNSSKDTHLLPGTMGVYLDEGYITNSSVPHVAPGDTFQCSLGKDYSVGVTFNQKSKRLEIPTSLFTANQEKILYTITCVVKNKRDYPIKGLLVRDVVPVSDNTIIKVVLLKPSGLAETEEGKDVKVEDGVKIRWCEPVGNRGGMKEGRVQWTVDLEARASKTLTLEWEVHHPSGQRWQYELQAPGK